MVHYAFVVKLNIRKMIPYEAMKPNFEYLIKKIKMNIITSI